VWLQYTVVAALFSFGATNTGGVESTFSVVQKLCLLIRLKRIYNFLCSMLVFTPFA
jgi:hypothetical protein